MVWTKHPQYFRDFGSEIFLIHRTAGQRVWLLLGNADQAKVLCTLPHFGADGWWEYAFLMLADGVSGWCSRTTLARLRLLIRPGTPYACPPSLANQVTQTSSMSAWGEVVSSSSSERCKVPQQRLRLCNSVTGIGSRIEKNLVFNISSDQQYLTFESSGRSNSQNYYHYFLGP